jgi:hypothetical protein
VLNPGGVAACARRSGFLKYPANAYTAAGAAATLSVNVIWAVRRFPEASVVTPFTSSTVVCAKAPRVGLPPTRPPVVVVKYVCVVVPSTNWAFTRGDKYWRSDPRAAESR